MFFAHFLTFSFPFEFSTASVENYPLNFNDFMFYQPNIRPMSLLYFLFGFMLLTDYRIYYIGTYSSLLESAFYAM